MANPAEPIRIDVTPAAHVTALAYRAPPRDRLGICLVLAHGAGAGQTSPFMVRFASALAARGIDAVTFNFLYTEERRRLPDRNDALEACWRAVIARFGGGISDKRGDRLVIGGKSMGGRIASQVAARAPDSIAGLILLGYPLHPPGKPQQLRVRHLPAIRAPMLFVQGERDAFGTPDELRPVIATLVAPAELTVVTGGDHSFKVPKKLGVAQESIYEQVLDRITQWLRDL
jgi:predicted alpha/beta-hydrolase family hydrolase